MSDDEGADLADDYVEEADAEADVEVAAVGSDDDLGLVEKDVDATTSEDENEDEDAGEVTEAESELDDTKSVAGETKPARAPARGPPGAPPLKGHPARPEAPKPDTLLMVSNRPRAVRIVPPDERVTEGRLHASESAYVLAMRAEQISKHATRFTTGDVPPDPVAIAFQELFERRCPLKLWRTVGVAPDGARLVEEWKVNEMTFTPLTPPVRLAPSAPARGTTRTTRAVPQRGLQRAPA